MLVPGGGAAAFAAVGADPHGSHGAMRSCMKDATGFCQRFGVDSRPFIVFVDPNGAIQKVFRTLANAKRLIPLGQQLLDAKDASVRASCPTAGEPPAGPSPGTATAVPTESNGGAPRR